MEAVQISPDQEIVKKENFKIRIIFLAIWILSILVFNFIESFDESFKEHSLTLFLIFTFFVIFGYCFITQYSNKAKLIISHDGHIAIVRILSTQAIHFNEKKILVKIFMGNWVLHKSTMEQILIPKKLFPNLKAELEKFQYTINP